MLLKHASQRLTITVKSSVPTVRSHPISSSRGRWQHTGNISSKSASGLIEAILSSSAPSGNTIHSLDQPISGEWHNYKRAFSTKVKSNGRDGYAKKPVITASEEALVRANSSSASILETLKGGLRVSKGVKTPPMKRKKVKKKATDKKDSYRPDSTAGDDSASASQETSGFVTERWRGEEWSGGWGPDKLKSTSRDSVDVSIQRSRPPHLRIPIPYTRRIEGLLEHSKQSPLQDIVPNSEHKPIAQLAHGLERVLFNPGVHWLQDPRSQVYNFPTWLQTIPSVGDFAFERLPGFIKSSRDKDLFALAKQENRTFAGSTSSLTGMLSQIYFLISGDKDVDLSVLTRSFQREASSFTPGQRMPTSVLFNYQEGVYLIDSYKESGDSSEKNILTWMGTLLEKFLTTSREDFLRYLRSIPLEPDAEIDLRKEAYRYAKSNRFVMRSQLDCQDNRLPGTGIFDIKTRAALPIRLDLLNFEENSGYLIRFQHGLLESFEKEYYDLIRSAFLKYSFQARIGNMDGVLVAYHNTARMFGFQYIPLEEMDERLFGAKGRGERVFEQCVRMLETVADEVIRCFPNQSVKCTFEAVERSGIMNVWVEPAEWSETESQKKPIMQLDVTAVNYVGDEQVRGSRAVSADCDNWTIHWTVSRVSSDEDEIRAKLAGAKERQFRAYNLPTGISIDQMAEFWNNLNFSGEKLGDDSTFDSANFKSPSKNIELLRALARAGRDRTDQMERESEGKQKVILGTDTNALHGFPKNMETGGSSSPMNRQEKMTGSDDRSDLFASDGTSDSNRPTFNVFPLASEGRDVRQLDSVGMRGPLSNHSSSIQDTLSFPTNKGVGVVAADINALENDVHDPRVSIPSGIVTSESSSLLIYNLPPGEPSITFKFDKDSVPDVTKCGMGSKIVHSEVELVPHHDVASREFASSVESEEHPTLEIMPETESSGPCISDSSLLLKGRTTPPDTDSSYPQPPLSTPSLKLINISIADPELSATATDTQSERRPSS